MDLTLNTTEVFVLPLIDKDTGLPLPNLASAIEIRVIIKDSEEGAIIIELNLTNSGVEKNQPVASSIRCTILPNGWGTLTEGDKYIAAKVKFSAADDRLVEIMENGEITNTVKINPNPFL